MSRRLSRVAVAVVFSALLAVVAVLPAAADGPFYREPLEVTDFVSADMCAFPVQATFDRNSQILTGRTQPDGSEVWRINGASHVTWTNLSTGYTFVESFSGPFTIIIYPDGSDYRHFRGRFAINSGPDAPEMWVWFVSGNIKVHVSQEGSPVAAHGNFDLICDRLNH